MHKMINGEQVNLSPAEEEALKIKRAAVRQELKDHREANDYRDSRSLEFSLKPSLALGEQLDAIYHGFKALSDAGLLKFPPETAAWLDSVSIVKKRHPKPE